jgi:DNA-directed RNA polymerase subunit F
MAGKPMRERVLSIPEVKKLLESVGEEKLDQFQRRTFDYASKFSKVEENKSEILTKTLIEQYTLDEEEVIQIVNCMPQSLDELRVFLGGGRKIIETTKLQGILNLLDEYRK